MKYYKQMGGRLRKRHIFMWRINKNIRQKCATHAARQKKPGEADGSDSGQKVRRSQKRESRLISHEQPTRRAGGLGVTWGPTTRTHRRREGRAPAGILSFGRNPAAAYISAHRFSRKYHHHL